MLHSSNFDILVRDLSNFRPNNAFRYGQSETVRFAPVLDDAHYLAQDAKLDLKLEAVDETFEGCLYHVEVTVLNS